MIFLFLLFLREFYEDWALLSQPTEREMLWGVLAPLSVVKFKLSFAIPFDTLPTSLDYYNQLQQLQALSAPAPPLPPSSSSSSSSTSSTPIPSPPSSGSLQTSTSEPTVDLLLINQYPSRPSLSLLSEMEGLSSDSFVMTTPPQGFAPLTPIPVFPPSPLTLSFPQGSSLPPPYPRVPPAPPRTGTPNQTQIQTLTQTQVEGNGHALKLQTEITNLQGRLRERDSAIDEKATELLMTKKMLEQKAMEVEELKRSVGNPNKLEDQALNIHALRTALEEATKEAEKYQQQLSAALRDSEIRKRDYEISNREREALREQLVFATSQLEFAATNASLGGGEGEQQRTIQQLREALEVHSSSSRTLEQELQQKDSLISALQTESALKSNSLEEVSLRVQQEEVLRSQQMNEMMKEIQLLRTDRERSHGEVSRLQDEVRRWKEEFENKQTEVESLRNRYAKLKGEVTETNQRLEKLDLEVRESKKNLRAKTEELEMYNRVHQEAEDKDKSTETTDDGGTGGGTGGVDQNQLALILNEAAELKSKKSELEALLEGKKEEVQKLKGRLEDAEKKINELTPPLKCTRSCQTDSEIDTNLLLKKKEEEVKSITTSWKKEEGKVSFLEGKLALGSSEFERFKRQVETDHTILHQTNASLINELQQANSERDAFAEMVTLFISLFCLEEPLPPLFFLFLSNW
jgi:hypothetical protein